MGHALQDVLVEAFIQRDRGLSLAGKESVQTYDPALLNRLCPDLSPDDYYYSFVQVRRFDPVLTRLVVCPEAWTELTGKCLHVLVRQQTRVLPLLTDFQSNDDGSLAVNRSFCPLFLEPAVQAAV